MVRIKYCLYWSIRLLSYLTCGTEKTTNYRYPVFLLKRADLWTLNGEAKPLHEFVQPIHFSFAYEFDGNIWICEHFEIRGPRVTCPFIGILKFQYFSQNPRNTRANSYSYSHIDKSTLKGMLSHAITAASIYYTCIVKVKYKVVPVLN
jgi:hypothetical protein